MAYQRPDNALTPGGVGPAGAGTEYKVDTTGNETVLFGFPGTDGSGPSGPVIQDPAGNLYGIPLPNASIVNYR